MRKFHLFIALVAIVISGILAGGCLGASEDCGLFYNCGTGGGQAGGGGNTGGTGGAPAMCSNGSKDGSETDVDCGGPDCGPCGLGAICTDKDGVEQSASCGPDGHCVDGVCCDKACNGLCEACASAKTGNDNGVCAPVPADGDPDNECSQDGDGTQICQKTGSCNGNRACELNGCSFPNAMAECDTNDVCTLGTCNAGFSNCDGDPTNGCEADFSTSVEHCGGCGKACVSNNATGVCTNGMCAVGMCNANFRDCNSVASDGCEVDTTNDIENCGDCSAPCVIPDTAMTVVCGGGTCAVGTCKQDFSDCDTSFANGCEVKTAVDVNNCGACGRTCSGVNVASKSCTGGVCDSTCSLGFGNCLKPSAAVAADDDGCETNVKSPDANCGGCGNNCDEQGSKGGNFPGFECDGGNADQKYCGCGGGPGECDTDGAGLATGACGVGGACTCSGTQCHPAEACVYDNAAAKSVCSCNLGDACNPGETCCQTPAGCFNLSDDPANCGACGHGCPPEFFCGLGACGCNADTDCNAGSPGSCVAGFVCTCGATTCAQGQRCQPDGTCG